TKPYLFAYVARTVQGVLVDQIVRIKDVGGIGAQPKVIYQADAGFEHHGGRMLFGSDGQLYVATGEEGDRANSQDLTNTLGRMRRADSDRRRRHLSRLQLERRRRHLFLRHLQHDGHPPRRVDGRPKAHLRGYLRVHPYVGPALVGERPRRHSVLQRRHGHLRPGSDLSRLRWRPTAEATPARSCSRRTGHEPWSRTARPQRADRRSNLASRSRSLWRLGGYPTLSGSGRRYPAPCSRPASDPR